MLNKIIDIIKKNDVQVWRVTEAVTESAELYFIRKKLDMPRMKEMSQYAVEIFRDFEFAGKKMRGSSTALISPGMTDEEIDSRVKSAYLAASFVKNPWFELADPLRDHKPSSSDLACMSTADSALQIARAMFSADTAEDAFINSAEIFVTRRFERIVASNGLDVAFGSDEIWGEMVTQCIRPIDVEQYRQFAFDKMDPQAMKAKVTEAIEDVRARARASQPPAAATYNIVLKGENLAELFEFYGARSAASMIFPGYSRWEAGMPVQGENIQGEKLNLFFESSNPYSPEGIPLPRRCLIRDGKLELVHGSTRYCRYLGIEPTGDYDKICCENGSMPISDMRSAGVLEPVSFSDFQMDYMDGHFKGEIRLALLYKEDGTVEELTGGSINGSLLDVQEQLRFSLEQYEDKSYKGPLAVLIPNVAVAGK